MNTNILDSIEYPKTGIISKDILDNNNNSNMTLFCMAKGSAMSEHTSTKEGYVYVLEGNGIFNLSGKNIRMKEGQFIIMEKNAKHSLKAYKNTSFLLILSKNKILNKK